MERVTDCYHFGLASGALADKHFLLEHRLFPAVDYCQQLILLDQGTTSPVDNHVLLSLIPQVILPEQLKKTLLDKPPHHNELWDVLKPFLRDGQAC